MSTLGSIDDDLDTPYTIASAVSTASPASAITGLPSGYTVTGMATEVNHI